ncbi:hypothetical protein LTR36_003737 [Oleoguttula mirabilis]|uniref:Uncharacterized protein n=1 Tax=Oleoguttula mirabilis TaxID=1507867 RepID=A0AAV9JHV6_9PEZI|nr:hypothetical protein LTR36_003737 [Oleoguttula mirabilis]
MASQDESPLLRNRIYHMVFEDHQISLTRGHFLKPYGRGLAAPGVLLGCHQTYEEGTGIFYSNATFTTRDDLQIYCCLPRQRLGLLRNIQSTTIGPASPPLVSGRVLATCAEYDLRVTTRQLRVRGVVSREGVLKIGVRTRKGGVIFTSTPKETYAATY